MINKGMKRFSSFLLIAIAAVFVASANASVVDLGAASGFLLLSYNSPNISDSAFNGGGLDLGVVNGDWNQSGGGQTDNQKAADVILSPGHSFNGPAIETPSFNAARLNNAWADAQAASATLAALTPTQTIANINSGLTITEATAGTYVLNIGNINLNQSSLTLIAPTGSTFVLNISGNVTLNGGSQGNGLLIGGGLTSDDVFYNLTGANSQLNATGGGNAQTIEGYVLATGANASVNLHPGAIMGQVFTTTFTSSSGALITATPPGMITQLPEVTPASVIFGFLGLIVAMSSRRMLNRRMRPVAVRK